MKRGVQEEDVEFVGHNGEAVPHFELINEQTVVGDDLEAYLDIGRLELHLLTFV